MKRIARLEHFARAGYLARALVYFLLGYLTLATAHAEGTASVLDDIRNLPAGRVVLIATAVGLIGYGIFRIYGAALDIQGAGAGWTGMAKRVGHVGSGIAHLVLAYLAVRLALDSGGGAGGSSGGTQAAETIMDFPGGWIVLGLIGIGFVGAAFNQAVKAATANFMYLLDIDAPRWAEAVGRIGYAARAVVFLVLGWHILESAWSTDAQQIGFQAALESLQSMTWLYQAVAAGLLVFGIFSLVMARYRKIRDQNVIDRITGGTARPI
ncbi:DUF1206 domain-containing protein [Stakelama saccharophila]|uniref:DUF1206 domain-containing protein n=1 Tax=Stakelama saccharophila TaxID=3075605 RepID=A0ABZ0B9J9_9SPHN|nr:DUF1206 domain-containing protein [Stakelama sp. W311]WNO53740.1 DUF1206 domain-containing protein [Stakelama sp. W311]